MTRKPIYSMTIDLNVLNHLGIGLYSSTPAVLSEVVANAWDADAKLVTIDIRPEKDEIVIEDDGIGMTRDELNQKYLRVGYRRRQDVKGRTTPLGRHVMGRKGIGKLSVFSVARQIEVQTVKDGNRSGLVMDREAIKGLMDATDPVDYHPEAIPDRDLDIEQGTRIVLREFDKAISATGKHLRRRLARRFSVIGPSREFIVVVDSKQISPKDRDFYKKLDFVWHLGQEDEEVRKSTKLLESQVVTGSVGEIDLETDSGSSSRTVPLSVTGWIGTVDLPESVDKDNNAIVVMSHGKLVHENLLPNFREAGVYADYVIGEINADFLDADDQDDIVTSGRQLVKEGDQRFELLEGYTLARLKEIKALWSGLRTKHGAKRALDNPVLREWYEKLSADLRKPAERLFGRLHALNVGDAAAKGELYKGALLAFERLALQQSLSVLDDLSNETDLETLIRLFGSFDELEAAHYYEIAKGRLSVIKKFQGLVPEALEDVLQQYVFDHIWLLDASWERAAANTRIEEAVTTEFKRVDAKLSTQERKGRIDLRYTSAAGKHIIIELKKFDASVAAAKLVGQVQKYRSALSKCLEERFPKEPQDIEIVCILGRAPTPRDQPVENRKMLAAVDARWYTYDQLLKDTVDKYSDYLDREEQAREVLLLADRLVASFEEAS